MSERWIQILCSILGLLIAWAISAFTFSDVKTATGTTIALIVGYLLRTWQTRRWHYLSDTESKYHKHVVNNCGCLRREDLNPEFLKTIDDIEEKIRR